MEFLSQLDHRYWQVLYAYMERNDIPKSPSERAKMMATQILDVLNISAASEALALFKSVDNLAEGLRHRGAFLNTPPVNKSRKSA